MAWDGLSFSMFFNVLMHASETLDTSGNIFGYFEGLWLFARRSFVLFTVNRTAPSHFLPLPSTSLHFLSCPFISFHVLSFHVLSSHFQLNPRVAEGSETHGLISGKPAGLGKRQHGCQKCQKCKNFANAWIWEDSGLLSYLSYPLMSFHFNQPRSLVT